MKEKHYLMTTGESGHEYIVAGPFNSIYEAIDHLYDLPNQQGIYQGSMTPELAKEKYDYPK